MKPNNYLILNLNFYIFSYNFDNTKFLNLIFFLFLISNFDSQSINFKFNFYSKLSTEQ